jgi:signal transduction histidine kinase/ActR/RegA family two-component response regulator
MVPRQLDKIGLRTPGAGTPMHFLGVMLATAGGVTYLHVPYQVQAQRRRNARQHARARSSLIADFSPKVSQNDTQKGAAMFDPIEEEASFILRLDARGGELGLPGSSAEALTAARRGEFAVGLIDLRLGADNGVDLVRALSQLQPDLVSVVLTGYASVETSVEALQAGAYDYLSKPVHTGDLLATLARCLERRRLARQRAAALQALQVRNRDLETLNAQLTAVLRGMRALSAAHRSVELPKLLLGIAVHTFGADGGALYLGPEASLELASATGIGYPARLAYPMPSAATFLEPGLAQWPPSPQGDAARQALLSPLAEGADRPRGALLLHTAQAGLFGQRELDLVQMLVSFGAEALRATRAMERLTASEGKLRMIVDHSPSAIAFEDLTGGRVLANERFNELFGPGTAELSPPARDVLAAGRAVTREIDAPTLHSLRRVLLTRFPMFDESGEAIGVGAIATDITEQVQTRERLQRAERLEAMGRVTGGVAHDFNNLLAVVLGDLRLIQEDVSDRPVVLELVEEALDATLSGVELTGRLLAVGRGQTLRPQPTDLREFLPRVLRLLQRALGETIEAMLDISPGLWSVCIDRGQLESSLLNLALNARDATGPGGRIVVTARNAVIATQTPPGDPERQPGPFVALSVRDNGVGMPAEIRARASQPFFSTKQGSGGSGLGLSIVEGFVRQSGGYLEIESAPGSGATITLYLPRHEGEVTSPAAVSDARAPRAPGAARVLVVEDQPGGRRLGCASSRGSVTVAEGVGDAAAARSPGNRGIAERHHLAGTDEWGANVRAGMDPPAPARDCTDDGLRRRGA